MIDNLGLWDGFRHGVGYDRFQGVVLDTASYIKEVLPANENCLLVY